MIVSDHKKFMFVHIYKTGGSSLTRVLSSYVDDRYKGVENPVFEGKNWQSGWHLGNAQHMWFSTAINHMSRDTNFDDYFKFTFVRHPITWLMSLYIEFYVKMKRNMEQLKLAQGLDREPGFDDFVQYITSEKAKGQWGNNTQFDFLRNQENITFDLIGKLENFNEDVILIMDKLNISMAEVPHLLSKGGGKKDLMLEIENSMRPETRQLIYKYYQEDFETFGYNAL